MKRTLTFCLIIIFTVISRVSWSQTDKGKFLLGGQFDLNFFSVTMPGNPLSYATEKTKTIGIAPQLGYFIFKNFSVGFEVLYNNKRSTTPTGNNFSRTFSFVPFLRYYIGKGKFKPYLHTGIGPGISKTGSSNFGFPEQTQTSKLLIYEIRGGVEFSVYKNIGFDFGFGYNSTTIFFKEPMVNGSYNEWQNISNGTTGTLAIVIYL